MIRPSEVEYLNLLYWYKPANVANRKRVYESPAEGAETCPVQSSRDLQRNVPSVPVSTRSLSQIPDLHEVSIGMGIT